MRMTRRKRLCSSAARRGPASVFLKRFWLPFLIVFLAAPLSAVQLNIKLTGGLSFFSHDHIDRALDDWAEWQRREAESRNLWTLQSTNLEYMGALTDLEGELLFRLHRRWGVSAGVGISYSDVSVDGAHLVITKSETDNDIAHPQKVSAVPLVLSVYHFLPLGKVVELYARIGAGWMSVDYYDQEASKKSENKKYAFSLDQSAGAGTGLFLAAAGLTVSTPVGLSFLLEAGWRQAAVSGLTSDAEDRAVWTMYTFEQYYSDLDLWRYRHSLFADVPAGPDVRGAEELSIDLSVFSLRLGIMIRF